MEPSSLSKEKLESHLAKMEDWYRAIIFDSNGQAIASKNVTKIDDKELR